MLGGEKATQVNTWAVPAGLLLALFVFASLVGGLLKIVLTLLWPSLAGTWAQWAAQPVHGMQWMLGHLSHLPGNDLTIPAMPVWATLALYAVMLLFLVPTAQSKLRIMFRGAPIAACAAALLLPLRSVERSVGQESLSLTLLSLGAGQCAVLQTPGGRTVIIDAGSSSLSDALRKCIAPYLRASGCTSVDTLVLTHGDYDHISAAAGLAQAYDVREVLTAGRFRAHAVGNPPAEALLKSLDAMDRPPRVVQPGDHIPLGHDADLEVLWPPAQPNPDAPAKLSSNDSAVVARINYAGRSILITGDIEVAAETALMKLYPSGALHADALVAPHHGSSESTTADFVRAVDPSAIVSSNDRTLTGKQKRLEHLVGDRPIYRTHRCGAVTLRIFRDGRMTVETYLHPASAPRNP